MDLFGMLNILALIYVVVAVGVVRRLRRAGLRATFDHDLTADDRRLISEIAFFLLTPPAILLHEGAHAAATWLLGGQVVDFSFAFYWGSVLPARFPPFTSAEHAIIAAAGPLLSVALGLGAIAVVLVGGKNRRPAHNLLWLTFGELQLMFALIAYPILSLGFGFGDYLLLRLDLNDVAPHAGDAVIAGVVVVAVLLLRYRSSERWKRRVLELTLPQFARVATAESRLTANPDDAAALRDMGAYHFLMGRPAAAIPFFERAIAAQGPDAKLLYNLALAESNVQGGRDDALAHLVEAKRLVDEDPADDAGMLADIESAIRWLERPGQTGSLRQGAGRSGRARRL